MKKTLLTLGLALSLTTTLLAQSNPKPAAAAAEPNQPRRYPAEVLKHEPYRDITLKPGTLRNVVQQLDVIFSAALENSSDVELRMPNLVWTEDVMDLSISAPLRLCDVMALDALTLVGAAAGCRLEPVESVPTDTQPKRVLGYKFVRVASGAPTAATALITESRTTARGNLNATTVNSPENTKTKATTAAADEFAVLNQKLNSLYTERIALRNDVKTNHPAYIEINKRIAELEELKNNQLSISVTRIYPLDNIILPNDGKYSEKLSNLLNFIDTLIKREVPLAEYKVKTHGMPSLLVVTAPQAVQDLVTQVFQAMAENTRTNRSSENPKKTDK